MDVVNLYNRGSVHNPNLDRLIMPLNLTKREKIDLVSFLEALTGPYPIEKEPKLPNPEITVEQLREMTGGGK
jgi:hypothetical protein